MKLKNLLRRLIQKFRKKSYTTINGVKWADEFLCDYNGNIKYYQWGSLKGYTRSQIQNKEKAFNLESYNSYQSSYCFEDAATNEWGSNWKIPGREDFKKLLDHEKVLIEHKVRINGVLGSKFTDKNTGDYIFFPYFGSVYDSFSIDKEGFYSYFWTTDLNIYLPNRAWRFLVNGDDCNIYYYGFCYQGCPIRPIKIKRD